jgi:O-antigen/teichoic acid export membrane protein
MSIYGDAYVPGFTALAIACCGVLLHTLSSSVEPALIMSGYPYLNLINNVFFVVVNLVADFLLIPAYGLIGAAIGSLTASLLTATLQTVMLYRVLHVQPLAWHYVWVLLYGLVFLILFKLLHSVLGEAGLYDELAVRILLFGTYVVSYLVLGWKWVLHDEERKVFRSIIQRKPS